jgi:iron complex transport system ATP-binding protein
VTSQAEPILNAVGLSFAYPGALPLITGVSVDLAPGELVGLAGPNGSGKTTLLNLLSGRLRPRSGIITLQGRGLEGMKRPEVARLVGVVAQNGHMSFPFSAREVVLMGRAARLRGLFETVEDLRVADEAMELTGTAEFAKRPFGQLSGGERQRVLVARALAQEPRLLLLDEPAAFLDLKHQFAVCELLSRLASERGLSVLAVFHDLTLAARFCHRLILLSGGRIAAQGDAACVLTAETIEDVFDVRVEVERDPATRRVRVSALGGRRA